MYGLSLLLVLALAPRNFLPHSVVFLLPNKALQEIQFDLETVNKEPPLGATPATVKAYLFI